MMHSFKKHIVKEGYERDPYIKKLLAKYDDPIQYLLQALSITNKLSRIGKGNTKELVRVWNEVKSKKINPALVEKVEAHLQEEGTKHMKTFKQFMYEAITDDRKEVAKALKKFAKKYVSGPISVTSGKGKTSYVQLRAKGGGEISNELRKMVIDKAMPKANPSNMDDIDYGNVTKRYIAISADKWKIVMGLKESVELDEAHLKKGDKVKWKGKVGTVVRYDKGGPQSPFYVISFKGQYKSENIPAHKLKESIELDEEARAFDNKNEAKKMAYKLSKKTGEGYTVIEIFHDAGGQGKLFQVVSDTASDEWNRKMNTRTVLRTAFKESLDESATRKFEVPPSPEVKKKFQQLTPNEILWSADSVLGGNSKFVVVATKDADRKGQDGVLMGIISNPKRGSGQKLFSYFGSHRNVAGAQKFAKNNKLVEGVQLDELSVGGIVRGIGNAASKARSIQQNRLPGPRDRRTLSHPDVVAAAKKRKDNAKPEPKNPRTRQVLNDLLKRGSEGKLFIHNAVITTNKRRSL